MKKRKNIISKSRGTILIATLVVLGIFFLIGSGLIAWEYSQYRLYKQKTASLQALDIAEAGINYYRWHLAHNEKDFTDGTGADPDGVPPNGPYVHNFSSADGTLKGKFSLEITPPIPGSTIVTIASTGWTDKFPLVKKTIVARYGIPSFSKFAVLLNCNVRFGSGTEIYGPVHSNGGIEFNGVAHNIVTSAVKCYDNPDTSYVDPCEDPGVWTEEPDPSQVFLAGKKFPVPAIDFNGILANLAQIKTQAQTSGFYLPYTGSYGYHIHFNSNKTFDVYKVTSLESKGWILLGYDEADTLGADDYGWTYSSFDINTEKLVKANIPLPSNGIIFVEDNVWVDGVVNGRVTLASGRFPATTNNYTNIIIDHDLTYAPDTNSVLGLIAQYNIMVGYYCDNNLKIDGALLAENGKIFRPYYYWYDYPNETYTLRDSITLNGSLAMNKRYAFAWGSWWGIVSGFYKRNIYYNKNLVYAPPPSFPTTGEYTLISWQEK